jgi:kumamolisin
MPNRRAVLAASVLAALAYGGPAFSQSVRLTESATPFARGVRVIGEADPAAIVHFQVVLRLRDRAGLEADIARGHTSTPAELEAAHLPLAADHEAVLAWLRGQGLTIEATVPSRMTISASGRADLVARALGVHFAHIVSEGQDYVAADSAPAIPAALAGIVLAINGLQPQLHAHTLHVLTTPKAGTTPYLPSDLLNAYTATAAGTGAGTTTAIVIDTLPKTKDLTSFWSIAGVPQSLSNITLIQVIAGKLPALSGEESLDTEYASSIAPASQVRVYAAQSLKNSALDTTFQRVITDLQGGTKITQVSISLGECETDISKAEAATDDQYFATMTSLGASVFVSSGDSGSHECSGSNKNVPSFYSTSPHVAAAGGTTLKVSGTKEKSETAWSGSGGGLSTIFAAPAYQSGLGYSARAVPDLSADANPNTGVLVIVGGKQEQIGGTSVASPVLAGLIGLINAQRIAAGKDTIGLLATPIYPLLKTANFRDITKGNNGGYTAGVGYDLVTGIGTPLLKTLLPTLLAMP